MLERIIRFSIRQRWLVLVLVAGAGRARASGTIQRLPIDAVPDITNVQVQINTEAPGYSPLEVEQRITFPIETAMAGLPRLDYTRSLSRYGLSQVTVVFEDGTDIYFARQLVNERLQQAREPAAAGRRARRWARSRPASARSSCTPSRPKPTARTSPTAAPYTPTDLRTLQDWIIRPQLRNVPGVTEVNTIGGYAKQFHVTPDPAQLLAYGLTLPRRDRRRSTRNNANVGAGYIERNGEQYLIRAPGQVGDIEDIARHRGRAAATACRSASRDVAEVRARQGAAHRRGDRERRGGRARHGRSCWSARTAAPCRSASPRSSRRSTRRLPRGRRRATPSTTAPTLVDRTIATVAEEPARRRAAGHRRAVRCCSATCARR